MKNKSRMVLVERTGCRKTVADGRAGWQSVGIPALLLAMMVGGGLFLAGCQSSEESLDAEMAAAVAREQTAAVDSSTDYYSTNLLEEGDVVSITFRYTTNYNTVEKISLDGTLNLDVAGQVKAANKTVLQLQDELTKLYQSEEKGDPLTVKVINAEAAVYVSGAVNKPGKIPLEHPMTVLDAIMEAGGSDPLEADLSDVLVLRVEKGQQHTYHFNIRRVLDGKDSTVFFLKPFDTVRVPAKVFNY